MSRLLRPNKHRSPIADRRSPTAGQGLPITDHGFAARIVAWQKQHGRQDLPWQNTRDPYRVWLSEIMLQQTQVSAVIPYYLRFTARFPNLDALAGASQDDVLRLWSGLGYYARARNLHRAARIIVEELGGRFPQDHAAVCALPGVGRSTAAAICAFAFGARQPILDGNVKRVLARYFGVAGYPGNKRVETTLWAHSRALLPEHGVEAYTQGLMDLGAGVCLRAAPHCNRCPVRESCIAWREDRIAELPTPRPAKPIPERSTTMLVLSRQGEVLLEKRPSQGIWGGLWCFPEIDGASVEDACVARYGVDVVAIARLDEIEHGFTHFRLRIAPVVVTVRPRVDAEEPGRIWLTSEDALGAAIPVPVRRILTALTRERNGQAGEVGEKTTRKQPH